MPATMIDLPGPSTTWMPIGRRSSTTLSQGTYTHTHTDRQRRGVRVRVREGGMYALDVCR
jgi:hypothetical protein